MYIQDNDREYELGWKEKVLDNFRTEYKTNTVTVVWESIPYHLSNSWMEEVFKEVKETFDYKPTEWVICANVIYVTFERKQSSHDVMKSLQKACYEK